MITIAFLDDGICSSAFPFLADIKASLDVADDGSVFQTGEPNGVTHGTLCAAVVRLYAPDAEIISIRVLDPITRRGTIYQIRYALEWCIAHSVSVINLSVGSVNFKDWEYLRPTVANLERNNIPLICACSNSKIPSVFTEFSWSISVKAEEGLYKNQFRPQTENFLESDFFASSTHTLVETTNMVQTFSSQNSHAAPVITAKVYQLLKEYGKLPIGKLLHLLQGNQNGSHFHVKPVPDFIDTAIVMGNPQYPRNLLTFSEVVQKENSVPKFLAIFPNDIEDNLSIEERLHSYGDNVAGILYAGSAPVGVKETARQLGCLFWDESEYIQAAKKISLQPNDSVAVKVLFQGSHITAVYLSQLLQKYLIDSGYRCKMFSDFPQAYCLGMVFLTKSIDTASYISFFAGHYQLDVVLVCGDSVKMDCDMVISCRESTILLEFDSSQMELDTTSISCEQIVKIIVDLLQ